jgi:hypothetical protein
MCRPKVIFSMIKIPARVIKRLSITRAGIWITAKIVSAPSRVGGGRI